LKGPELFRKYKNHPEPYLVQQATLPGTSVLPNGKSSGIPCCYETKYFRTVWALNQILLPLPLVCM